MRWLETSLSDVLLTSDSGIWGDDDAENGVSVLRSTNIESDGTIDFSNLAIRSVPTNKRNAKLLAPGDIILENSGGGPKQPVGRVCYFQGDNRDHVVGNFCRRLRANSDVIVPRYLFWSLFYAHASGETLRFQTQTTGIRNLQFQAYAKQPLALPPLSEQRRIVEILDEADRLRRLRREADAKAARILPALFLKMFGDPATNPRGWPVSRVRDLAIKYSDGPFGSNLKSDHYVPDGVRVIRLQNIGVGRLIDTDKAFISFEHFSSISKHECRPGDVLIGTLGDPNLRACIQPDEIALALNKADCVQLRVNPEKVTREFACWLLNTPGTLSLAQGLVLGQTRSRISMGRLGELLVPVPPLELQEDFSRKVQVVNSALAKTDSVCRKVENLFNSLMERAFSGQLTAKWREAHIKELLAEMEQQARLLNLPLQKELKTTP